MTEERLEREGAIGRLHPLAGADEHRIVEDLADPRERVAHRRLREPDPRCCARDVPLREQRIERDQEVEVEAGQMHVVHVSHAGKPLYR